MQQSSLRLAAVLAVALLSPAAALAFDIQSGSMGPGATAQPYADPEVRFDPDGTPRYDVDTDEATGFGGAGGKTAPNGTTMNLGHGGTLQFGVSGNGADSSGLAEPGWSNPQAGRMTR
jgi:hypothetical protein